LLELSQIDQSEQVTAPPPNPVLPESNAYLHLSRYSDPLSNSTQSNLSDGRYYHIPPPSLNVYSLRHQGLSKVYERGEKWDEYAETLLELAMLFGNSYAFLSSNRFPAHCSLGASDDATKCAETIQKLIDLRREHGSRRQACPPDALNRFPDSQLTVVV
jgi:hypothetical protein